MRTARRRPQPTTGFRGRVTRPRSFDRLRRATPYERLVLLVHRPNVLIEGRESDVETTLVMLSADFADEVHSLTSLTSADCGDRVRTIVVRDIEQLDRHEWQRVREWLDLRPRRQIVCTSSGKLFDLAKSGAFPIDLYYRLNTLRLAV